MRDSRDADSISWGLQELSEGTGGLSGRMLLQPHCSGDMLLLHHSEDHPIGPKVLRMRNRHPWLLQSLHQTRPIYVPH